MDLAALKKNYAVLKKKHNLPPFEKVNENFEIDKIDKDTEIVIRAVRKAMIDKIVNSLNFLEMLLNQLNSPRLYIAFLRSLTAEDKQLMEKMYYSLGQLSMASLELEIDYSEKQEAETIKKIYSTWISIKPSFKEILKKIRNPPVLSLKKEKSYFG